VSTIVWRKPAVTLRTYCCCLGEEDRESWTECGLNASSAESSPTCPNLFHPHDQLRRGEERKKNEEKK